MESFFKAHLFNDGMNYIFTFPELREQFGKWIRLKDLHPEERTMAIIAQRMKFLALKLKGIEKDEAIFDMKKDPFIKILYGFLANSDMQMFYLLSSLFPESMNQQTAALHFINFSGKTKEKIWKHFDPILFTKKFKTGDGIVTSIEPKRQNGMGADYDLGLPSNQLQQEAQDDSDEEEDLFEVFDAQTEADVDKNSDPKIEQIEEKDFIEDPEQNPQTKGKSEIKKVLSKQIEPAKTEEEQKEKAKKIFKNRNKRNQSKIRKRKDMVSSQF